MNSGSELQMKRSLHKRLLYSSIAGALGAFAAWLIAEPILGMALESAHGIRTYIISATYGTIVGMLIGASIGIAEGLMHRTLRHIAMNATLGIWLGAIGGCIGMLIAESLYSALTMVKLGMGARALGWACFGAFVGSAQGVARQSLKGTINSLIGGAIGGMLGGLSFEVMSALLLGYSATSSLQRGIGFIIIGMLVGIFSALFEQLLAHATLKVISGRMEGREFVLDKPRLVLGRDERCDIPIYYDRDIAPKHALLEWDGNTYRVASISNASLLHCNKPVKVAQLSHNDIITVGNTRLIYRMGRIITVPLASNVCQRCGTANRHRAKFCNKCGTALPPPTVALTQTVIQVASSIAMVLITLSVLIGATHFLSLHIPITTTQGQLRSAIMKAQLAVTPRGYDDIGQVLRELGEGYEFEQISLDSLKDVSYLQRFQVVFINCSWRCLTQNVLKAASSIRRYVENGGTLYASDWAGELVQRAFPEYVRIANDRGEAQTVNATVIDDALASIVGRSLSLRFNAPGWFPIESVAGNVTVYMIGSYRDMSGLIHEGRPLLISFRHGNGFVVFTCFHNEPQLSDVEKKLLQFLVVRPITFELSEKANSLLVAKRGTAVREFIGTISSGRISPPYSITLKEKASLLIVLTWSGGDGEFEIHVRAVDGKTLQSVRGQNPPITIETEELPPHTYIVRLTALQTPFENTPYVLRIGMR